MLPSIRACKALIQLALQLAGDEPVGRIDCIVLSTGMSGLVAGLQ
jgi:hypothetical protein